MCQAIICKIEPDTQVSTSHTRFSSNVNFYVKHSFLNKLNNSFSRTGPKIWNSIPCDLRNFPMNKFKKTLHKVLVSIFTNEEDYVDIAMLTNRLKKYNN